MIDLPVVVRNYLPQAQQLSVEMKPANWFELEHPGKQEISVGAGESTTAIFPFLATAMVKAGKQQVYGANRTTGDAVEKTVTVHPNGRDQTSTVTGILHGDSTLSLNIPADLIPGSVRARLKIYPTCWRMSRRASRPDLSVLTAAVSKLYLRHIPVSCC